MFRKMRRSKQEISCDQAIEILEKNTSGVLALSGDDDYPYAVPLSYCYHDNKIYFHGAKQGHKIDAMKRNNKASFCVIEKDQIVPEEFTTYFKSVIAFGKIEFLEDDESKRKAVVLLSKKYSPNETEESMNKAIEKEWTPLFCYALDIEHLTGKFAIELINKK